jgi:hypothetical protein
VPDFAGIQGDADRAERLAFVERGRHPNLIVEHDGGRPAFARNGRLPGDVRYSTGKPTALPCPWPFGPRNCRQPEAASPAFVASAVADAPMRVKRSMQMLVDGRVRQLTAAPQIVQR